MSRKKLKVGTLYHVKWVDAIFRWDETPEEIGSVCLTQGILIKVNDSGIRLAWERGISGEETRFLFDIPWGCVLGISKKPY